ncbi:MAG: hypothetical protein ACKPKD_25820 [Microcystis panniformis]
MKKSEMPRGKRFRLNKAIAALVGWIDLRKPNTELDKPRVQLYF